MDHDDILAHLRLCGDKDVRVGVMGGSTATLRGVYPPHSRSPLLQPTSNTGFVSANMDKYCLRPCVQGTYVDPDTEEEFINSFADVVCVFVRVDVAGVATTPPLLLLQWHETSGLERCNDVAPCTIAYLGVRYSILLLSEGPKWLTRTSPVAVVPAPVAGLLTDRQHPVVKVRSLTTAPQTLSPMLAAHMFGGMHTT
jgi:hypothetical protein